jgi:serine/threonine-protein kinase
MGCLHCGAPTSPDARFCATCGRALGSRVDGEARDAPTFAPPTPADGRTARLTQGGEAVTQPARASDHRTPSSDGWLTSSDSIDHGRFAPGAILDARYRIIGLLGKGGMGEVYRADDLRLGQPVALKFLPAAVSSDPVRLAQFHNEVRTARQVSHPNICRVYDIGEVAAQLFLSMEYVDGEDLATSLRRIGRFAEDKAIDVARQLCAGLAAAHERGVLHRDLKPANVMLDGAGRVRLMDFGLAAVGAVDDVRAGTPAYMAPEQLAGREVTARSDIYALGLVLYELYTGRRAFNVTTLNELIAQHQSGTLTSPRAIVPTLDPAVERAILRCLDPDPARRPGSPLAVAAALPGGDPLAAALAAGETPSPEMVAAAGEGAGLSRRTAVLLGAGVMLGLGVSYMLAARANGLESVRPEFTAEILAQKARDLLYTIGYQDRPEDEAYAFEWNGEVVRALRDNNADPPQWPVLLSGRPSPLQFWYRSSRSPMLGITFHHDLLTPGIVTRDDPAPIESGMISLVVDHRGRLLYLEAIPPQVEETTPPATPPDWTPLLHAAGLDPAALQPTAPRWHWLAAADTRAAWTGTWPGSTLPLRVEAAARGGRAVGFQAGGSWTRPWRTTEATTGQDIAYIVLASVLILAILAGASVLARSNLRAGRGDRAAAQSLGGAIAAALWLLWLSETHPAPSIGMLGVVLLTVCTTVFYAALFWAIYLALEPLVRRYWPQTLVSWTTLLGGRWRDAIVGRDVLIGVALGVLIALVVQATELANHNVVVPPDQVLLGLRGTIGAVLKITIYAVRTALLVFFLLFLLRLLLGRGWAAALVFVALFTALGALGSSRPLLDGASALVYFGLFAYFVLRWGLTTLAVGVLAANALLSLPATFSLSAWYLGSAALIGAVPLGLAVWALSRSVAGRLSTQSPA